MDLKDKFNLRRRVICFCACPNVCGKSSFWEKFWDDGEWIDFSCLDCRETSRIPIPLSEIL